MKVQNLFSILEKEKREIAAWTRIMVVYFCDYDSGWFRETNQNKMISRLPRAAHNSSVGPDSGRGQLPFGLKRT